MGLFKIKNRLLERRNEIARLVESTSNNKKSEKHIVALAHLASVDISEDRMNEALCYLCDMLDCERLVLNLGNGENKKAYLEACTISIENTFTLFTKYNSTEAIDYLKGGIDRINSSNKFSTNLKSLSSF